MKSTLLIWLILTAIGIGLTALFDHPTERSEGICVVDSSYREVCGDLVR